MDKIITRRSWYNQNYYEIHKLCKQLTGYCKSNNIKLLDKRAFQKEFMEIFYKSSINC